MNTQQYIDLIADVTANQGLSILGGILTTLFLFLVTLFLGTLLGLRLFMWYYDGNKIVVRVLNALDAYMTYIPMSTFLIFVFYVFFRGNSKLNMLAAIIALSVIFAFSVYWSMQLTEANVDKGEIDAAASMGYNKKQILFKVIIPSKLPLFLDRYETNVIAHVQNTAIVEIISVMDIQMVSDIIAKKADAPIIPILITSVVYFLIGVTAAKLIQKMAKELNREKTAQEQKDRFQKGKF